jgi:hypothetical protein
MSKETQRTQGRSFFSRLKAGDLPSSPLPSGEVCDRSQEMGPEEERLQEGTRPEGAASESIELGSFHLMDELNAPFVADRPKPHGLLPVPPEVEAAVAEEDAWLLKEHGILATPDDRQRQLNSLTLQYYFGGLDVAYRLTPQGVEVLAVHLAEIRELVQGMSQEELLTIKIGQP